MKCVNEVKDNAEKHDKLINSFEKLSKQRLRFPKNIFFLWFITIIHGWYLKMKINIFHCL